MLLLQPGKRRGRPSVEELGGRRSGQWGSSARGGEMQPQGGSPAAGYGDTRPAGAPAARVAAGCWLPQVGRGESAAG